MDGQEAQVNDIFCQEHEVCSNHLNKLKLYAYMKILIQTSSSSSRKLSTHLITQ